jgi:hypothetical protein
MKRKKIAIEPGLNLLDHPELLGISTDQERRVLPVLQELLVTHNSRVADLLFGRASDLWNQTEIRALENSIINDLQDPKLACDSLRLLYKAVTAWVMRNPQDVPFPRQYTLPKYCVNPLPSNLRRVFNTYDAWKELLTQQLTPFQSRLKRNADRNVHAAPPLEIVIASAIIYGGIHDMRTLLGIVRGMSDAFMSECGLTALASASSGPGTQILSRQHCSFDVIQNPHLTSLF